MINQAVEIHRARGDLLRLGGVLRLLAIQLGKNGSQAKARAAVSEAVTVLEQLPPARNWPAPTTRGLRRRTPCGRSPG
jgi:hypothetical protein